MTERHWEWRSTGSALAWEQDGIAAAVIGEDEGWRWQVGVIREERRHWILGGMVTDRGVALGAAEECVAHLRAVIGRRGGGHAKAGRPKSPRQEIRRVFATLLKNL